MSNPLVDHIRELLTAIEREDYNDPAMLTIITRDRESGVITISSYTQSGIDEKHQLFRDLAHLMGYARIQ